MRLFDAIKKDGVLLVFVGLLVVLSFLYPHQIIDYPHFVDWKTIIALTGLLIITTGIKESMFFDVLSVKIIGRCRTERSLSIFLIFLSVFLSMFLTNDIALFVVVPLTLRMQRVIENDISKMIVFEAISVNVGSALTPIGNPQNLFLWHRWGLSFLRFVEEMFPLVVFLLLVLLGFAWVVFPDREIRGIDGISVKRRVNIPLLVVSAVMLLVYVVSLELK